MGVRVLEPAYVQYRHSSLVEAEKFLTDFGLVVAGREKGAIYFRGVESQGVCYVAHLGQAEFVCGGFTVKDHDVLERASQTIPGASGVLPLPGPQGGYHVQLRDPDGFRIDLVSGRVLMEPLLETTSQELNYGDRKQRFGAFQRFEQRPARVRRLGHFGFNVSSFERTLDWYRANLGLLPSDTLHTPDDKDVAAFMRVARGGDWVDHHSIFFLESPTVHVHHCSFEVQDPDEVMTGSEWLKSKGWKQFWGVGRHILGSQVFDYWRDPSNFMIEHYADGDLLSEEFVGERHNVADETLAVWGPQPPKDFLD